MCHSRTGNMAEIARQADILVVAIGRANMIDASYVKPGAVVIDVGMNRLENGKLAGDVDFESVKEVSGPITPVPGGGPYDHHDAHAEYLDSRQKAEWVELI